MTDVEVEDRDCWNCRSRGPHRAFGSRWRCEVCGSFEKEVVMTQEMVEQAIESAMATFAGRFSGIARIVARGTKDTETSRVLMDLADGLEPRE